VERWWATVSVRERAAISPAREIDYDVYLVRAGLSVEFRRGEAVLPDALDGLLVIIGAKRLEHFDVSRLAVEPDNKLVRGRARLAPVMGNLMRSL
jgi:hypothetical protein